MKRNTLVNHFEANPKTIFAQNALYNNMSHHYRKLYNAKPCVDTSPPKSYKLLRQKEKNSTCKNRNEHAHMNGLRPNGQSVSIVKRNILSTEKYSYRNKAQDNNQKDVLEDITSAPFCPRILKTGAQSKIRSYREYHPPRKKPNKIVNNQNAVKNKNLPKICEPEPVQDNDQEENYVEYEDDCDWLQPPHQPDALSSKPSSSDSAYTEEGEGMWSGGDSRDESPQQMYPPNWSTKLWTDDHLYIKFLRTITDEVLRKGIYTNKALKILFQEHIDKNRHRLDVKRMKKEVDKLQQDLGIPMDDDLNNLDFGLGSGSNLPQNFVDFSDHVEIIDSIKELSIDIKENGSKTEEWLSNKHASSWSNISDDIELPLKLPNSDNDNDSIIGCEILTGSTDKNSIGSVNSIEDR